MVSIIIPVYNEAGTIGKIIETLQKLNFGDWEKEIVVVNDHSTDETKSAVYKYQKGGVKLYNHEQNQGKGAAIRTGLEKAHGELIIIQDADLEYNPQDIRSLIVTYENNPGCAIYGSRFRGRHQDTILGHRTGNYLLTVLTNLLYGSELSDMETCYKLIPRKYFLSFKLTCRRFDFEPEVTAKLLKLGVRILEVPVNYKKRGFSEGKKIKWFSDGVGAVWTLVKYRFIND